MANNFQESATASISGSSMHPFFCNGDKVMLSPFSLPPSIGTCYVFKKDTNYLIHRLFDINNNIASLIGDNSECIQKIHEQKLLAKAYNSDPHYISIIIHAINYFFIKFIPNGVHIRRKLISVTVKLLRIKI